MIESLIYCFIMKIIEDHSAICMINFLELQFDFLPSRSSMMIFSLLQSLFLTIKLDDLTLARFCDLSKPFDCINQEIYWCKLLDMWFPSQEFRQCASETISWECSTQLNIKRSIGISFRISISHRRYDIYFWDNCSTPIYVLQ